VQGCPSAVRSRGKASFALPAGPAQGRRPRGTCAVPFGQVFPPSWEERGVVGLSEPCLLNVLALRPLREVRERWGGKRELFALPTEEG